MATMYEFGDGISSKNCIYWSKDYRLALCTDTSIKILTLESCVQNTEPRMFCHQSAIPVKPDVLDIPNYTAKHYQNLLNKLPKDLELQLITDKVLNPFKFTQNAVPATSFMAAAWSPLGASSAKSCVLATLSRDHRLVIYTQRLSFFKWFEVCDLSARRLKESRPDEHYRKPERLSDYRRWCYSQAYTALTWSPVLYRDEMRGVECAVLVAGTKSGEIVVWKTDVPTDTGSDCNLFRSFTIHQCQVTDLVWSELTGTLAVGYLDGQVHVMQLNLVDPAAAPVSRCLHADSDLLRVSAMCFIPTKQGGEILLVNKEDCVLGYHLDQNQGLLSHTHVIGESTMHGTGLCGFGDNCALLASLDGVIQKIQLSTEDGDLKMTIERHDPRLPVTFVRVSVCLGLTVSPNQVFWAFLQRPSPGYDHLTPMYKAPTKIHIITAPHFMGNSLARSSDEIVQRLKNVKGALCLQLDVLEELRQSLVGASDTSLAVPGVGFTHRDLKLHRYVLLVKLCKMQNKHDIVSEEVKAQEVLKKMQQSLIQTTLQILALHIQTCVENINKTNCDVTTATSKKVLRAMKTFLETNHHRITPLDLRDTIQQLNDLIGQSDVAMETECAICSCSLTLAQLQLKCNNGHVFELCGRTLQPCEGIDYWRCSVCRAVSLSPEQLKEFDWLGPDYHTCVLCEGYMSQ